MMLLAWIIGVLTGALAIKFFSIIKKMDWYFLVLTVIWYAFGVFTAAFAQTSFAEGEPQAGTMALLIFGGIFVVLGVVIYIFGVRKAQGKVSTGEKEVAEKAA